jgi:hypothetical protein
VVITLTDATGDEITHAIELHVIEKPVPTPAAPAPKPQDATANAGKQPKNNPVVPVNPAPAPGVKKTPDDPELKALGDKICKKMQDDLDADSRGNTEYTSTFSVYVGNAKRTGADTGTMELTVHEDRAFLVGGDFINYMSHIDVNLQKVNGVWTCTHAQSTLDMASTSHGPLDLPFPPKTHDLTRSLRGLLDDAQDEPADPKPDAPKAKPDAAPSQRA